MKNKNIKYKQLNFIVFGGAGYIAKRHLESIKNINGNVLAVYDPVSSIGIIDKYFINAQYFNEFELLERYIDKLKTNKIKIDYIVICTPNYLHDSHIKFALRHNIDAICEKPVVIKPHNLTLLDNIEKKSKNKVNLVLQLRLHSEIIKLKKKISKNKFYDINLNYITPRGNWYLKSWKGDFIKSGGVLMNIGIHFFDMLIWVFGKVKTIELTHLDNKKAKGIIEFKNAKVNWFLSIDNKDLPKNKKIHRELTINNESFDFSKGFDNLHTEIYKNILQNKGFKLKDAKLSINLVNKLNDMNKVRR